MDVPMEIMQIIRKHTSWQTMEDIDRDANKASKYWNEIHAGTIFDIKDLEKELGKIKELYSDLMDYDDDSSKFLQGIVENAKLQTIQKFQGIQNKEAYKKLFTAGCNQYWYELILGKRRLDDTVDYDPMETDDDVEISLNLKGELVGKVLAARNLCTGSNNVRHRVLYLKNTLEAAVDECRRQLEYDDATREKMRKKQNLQCLCNVMKEVLGDRVENVVVSIGSDGPCMLKDSGNGGKRMEINPRDLVIEDLLKRIDADKNEFHVRNENLLLLLFNHAELYWKIRQKQPAVQTVYG